MGKVTLQKPTGSEFRGLLMNWPKSQVTHEIQAINDFKFHHVLLTWLVLWVSSYESSCENHFFTNSSPNSHTQPLHKIPQKYRKIIEQNYNQI